MSANHLDATIDPEAGKIDPVAPSARQPQLFVERAQGTLSNHLSEFPSRLGLEPVVLEPVAEFP